MPVFGWALRHSDHIIIDRSNHVQAMKSLRAASEKMRSGLSVIIFPEGTRGPGDGTMLPWKRGGFVLALDAGIPIVPIAVEGSADVLGRRGWQVRSGTIDVVVGAPVPVAGLEGDELMRRVRERLEAMLPRAAAYGPRPMRFAETAMTAPGTPPLRVIPLGGLGEIGLNLLVARVRRHRHRHRLRRDVPRRADARRRPGDSRPRLISARSATALQGHLPDARPRGPHRRAAVRAARARRAGLRHAAGHRASCARGCASTSLPATLRVLPSASRSRVGPFAIEPFAVTHSILDAVGLGDPHAGRHRRAHAATSSSTRRRSTAGCPTSAGSPSCGAEGVLLLLSDSTNVEHAGVTPSERIGGRAPRRDLPRGDGARVRLDVLVAHPSHAAGDRPARRASAARSGWSAGASPRTSRIARDLGLLRVADGTLRRSRRCCATCRGAR